MRRIIRTLLTLTVGVALLGSVVPGAPSVPLPSARAATTSQLAQAKRQERLIGRRIARIRHAIAQRDRLLQHRLPERPSMVPALTRMTTTELGAQRHGQHLLAIQRWNHRRHEMIHRVHRIDVRRRRRALELSRKRSSLRAWIAQWGIFETCPVRGYHDVTGNFGVTVRVPDVPVHVHQGNDILSTFGTPIVAPFPGRAVASSNGLGGLAVKVYGARGYVYNAHLGRYGTLGHVSAGTVIGYVGATGDARGPHDHFEWHPGNGPAVDPYPYLSVVC